MAEICGGDCGSDAGGFLRVEIDATGYANYSSIRGPFTLP
jgi:hypothetical protein